MKMALPPPRRYLPVAVVALTFCVVLASGHHRCSHEKHVFVQPKYCLDKRCDGKRFGKWCDTWKVCCDKMKTTMYENCNTTWSEQGRCLPEDQCERKKSGKETNSVYGYWSSSSGPKKSSDVCYQDDKTTYYCCPRDQQKAASTLPVEKKSHFYNDNTYPTCTTWREMPGRCVPLPLCDNIYSWWKRNYKTTFGDLQRNYTNLPEKFKCRSKASDGTAVCCPEPSAVEQQDLIRHKKANELNLHKCGPVDSQNRVLNGGQAALGQYPWMANLMYMNKSGKKEPWCGGSLIHPRFVLTAAHCSKGRVKPIAVRLGEYDLSTLKDCAENTCAPQGFVEYEIEKFICHTNYSSNYPGQFDIALVWLKKEVEFIRGQIHPICLPITKHWLMMKPAQLTLTGWGLTERGNPDILQQATLRPELNKWCPKEQMICARGAKMEGSCGGDSGGPWQQVRSYGKLFRMVLFGVHSRGDRECSVKFGAPSMMVSVGYHMDWILDTMFIKNKKYVI